MGWKSFTPSRTLNESGFSVFGLNMPDLMILIVTLSALQPLFHFVFGMSLLTPVMLVSLATLILMRIRRKYRRHIIRDAIPYLYYKLLKRGVRHEARTNRA